MIDYSLYLVAVKDSSGWITCDGTPGSPFCLQGAGHVYTVSIIDYLNDFTFAKKVESKVKMGVEHNKFYNYRLKFVNFAKKICRTAKDRKSLATIRLTIFQKYTSLEKA